MEIPSFLIEEIKAEVTNDFEGKYILASTGKDFSQLLNKNLNNLLNDLSNVTEIHKSSVASIIDTNRTYKKRLLNQLKKETTLLLQCLNEDMVENNELLNKSLLQQIIINTLDDSNKSLFCKIENINTIFNGLKNDGAIDNFINLYNADNMNDYILSLLEFDKLTEWMENNECWLSDFEFLKFLSLRKINSYFGRDIQKFMYSYLLENFQKGRSTDLQIMSKWVTKFPLDITNKKNYKENTYIYMSESEWFTTKGYKGDLDVIIQSCINQTLTELDISILQYLLSVAETDFFSTRTVSCDLGEIVRHIYGSKASSKDYKRIANRIYRLNLFRVIFVSKDFTNQKPFTIIKAEVNDSPLSAGKKVIVAEFSKEFIEDIMKKGPISVYRNIVNSYELSSSKILIYSLQNERYDLVRQNLPLTKEYTYTFFKVALFLSNAKKKDNDNLILRTLQEIMSSGLILKSFSVNKDIYQLEYLPVSAKERMDLANLLGSFSKKISSPIECTYLIKD